MAKHIQTDIPNDYFRIMEKWIDAAFRRGGRLPAGLVSSTIHEDMRMCVHAEARPCKFSKTTGDSQVQKSETVSLTKAQWKTERKMTATMCRKQQLQSCLRLSNR